MAGTPLVHSSAPDPVGPGHARHRAHGGAGPLRASGRLRAGFADNPASREEPVTERKR